MNTLYLKYFIEVVNAKSFNKAATKLFLNRSSLMAAINSLEKEVGYRLLNRNIHGVSLTPKGTKVYQDALEILNKIDVWQEEKDLELKKTIHIYSLPALSETFTLDILSQLIKKFPGCDFMAEGITNDIRLMIKNATCDNEENNLIIGGYYEMEKDEFDYLIKTNNCIAIPLFSSSHSVYYNIEMKRKYGLFTELNDFMKDEIKLITFPAAKASIVHENTFHKQQRVSVMSIHQAFNLISSVPNAAGLYPSFLKKNNQFTYSTVAALDVPDTANIYYYLIINENIMDDATIRRVIEAVVDYATKEY